MNKRLAHAHNLLLKKKARNKLLFNISSDDYPVTDKSKVIREEARAKFLKKFLKEKERKKKEREKIRKLKEKHQNSLFINTSASPERNNLPDLGKHNDLLLLIIYSTKF
jgi:phosphopantetheine adenylyltransferase